MSYFVPRTSASSVGRSATVADFTALCSTSVVEDHGAHLVMKDDDAFYFVETLERYCDQEKKRAKAESGSGESKGGVAEEVPPEGTATPLKDLPPLPSDEEYMQSLLNKVVIVKLNGGLGTGLGIKDARSAVVARDGLTFLDLTVRHLEYINQRYGADVPLLLLTSFKTHHQTERVLKKYSKHHINVSTMVQSAFPHIDAEHLGVLPDTRFDYSSAHLWYPPGHGDVFRTLAESGRLREYQALGKEYFFISNVDNLGATLDLRILHMIVDQSAEFCVEVAKRTKADTNGGVLVSRGGKLAMRELSADETPSPKLNLFNTNNIWVNLEALNRVYYEGAMKLPVIGTEVTLEGERPALVLETGAASAIEYFEKPKVVQIPRMRFFPVKKTSDMLLLESSLFKIQHGTIVRVDGERKDEALPVIKLGPEFNSVAEFRKRIRSKPDITNLEHLNVSGDVYFGKNVTLTGTVVIVANAGCRLDIPDGSLLMDKVVTGSMRILDH